MAAEAADKEGKSGKTRKLGLDVSNVKSAYCNFLSVHDTPEEVVVNFGFSQHWDPSQKDLKVQMQQQVIMHPNTARKLAKVLVQLLQKHDAPAKKAAEGEIGHA
jgi:hypothetical protein